eukprot:TRINITY_DN15132_c0_g1_i1.p1 TRINITY_DN15132_c0_g1~~TRINITY_DN15132_c0_g1_i1.p1  ORF type:complete len:1538 (+),score=277.79 TRINITY_DN15132_c0_g1_i1:87-4700(+)
MPLLAGEVIQVEVDNIGFIRRAWDNTKVTGKLTITNYQILFNYEQVKKASISIPYGTILKFEKVKDKKTKFFRVECRDFRVDEFYFDMAKLPMNKVKDIVKKFIPSSKVKTYFAFRHRSNEAEEEAAWNILFIQSEYERQGLDLMKPDCPYQISANEKFQIPTYPKILLLPRNTTNHDVYTLRQTRHKGRFPVISWVSPHLQTTLCRSAEKVPSTEDIGYSALGIDKVDSSYLEKLRATSGSQVLRIMNLSDVGATASSNTLVLNIPEFNNLKSGVAKLRQVCMSDTPPESSAKCLQMLETSTKIKEHQTSFLHAAATVVKHMMSGESVLVEYGIGADNTTHVVLLAQLLLDPYYRTLNGFAVLIEKEFGFGQQFREEAWNGYWLKVSKNYIDPLGSPFLLIFNSVWVLLQLFPQAFEFTEELLQLIMESIFSCRFGNFIYPSSKAKDDEGVRQKAANLWAFVQRSRSLFLNPFFTPSTSELALSDKTLNESPLWFSYFFRYSAAQRIHKAITDYYVNASKSQADSTKLTATNLLLPCFPLDMQDSFLFDTLTEIDLSGNMITVFPYEIFRLKKLETLNLSRNLIQTIADCVLPQLGRLLTSLSRLDLSENLIRSLPKGLEECKTLKTLILRNNRLHELPFSASNNSGPQQLSHLHCLDLSGNTLPSEIPLIFFEMRALDILGYSSGGKLSQLPYTIGFLQSLRELHLPNNGLQRLPITIARIRNLTWIDLTNNQFEDFPLDLLDMKSLQVLHLSGNRIKDLPMDLAELINLQNLSLKANLLRGALSHSIGGLDSLTSLDISQNQITHIPACLGSLGSLTKINVEGNPLREPSKEIVSKGPKVLIEHLKSIFYQLVPCYKATLMVLGPNHLAKNLLVEWLGELDVSASSSSSSSSGSIPIGTSSLGISLGAPATVPSFAGSPNSGVFQVQLLSQISLPGSGSGSAPSSGSGTPTSTGSGPPLGREGSRKSFGKRATQNPLIKAKTEISQSFSNPFLTSTLQQKHLSGQLIEEVDPDLINSDPTRRQLSRSGENMPRNIYFTRHQIPTAIDSKKISLDLETWVFDGKNEFRLVSQFFFKDRSVYLIVLNSGDWAEAYQELVFWLQMISTRTQERRRVLVVNTYPPPSSPQKILKEKFEELRKRFTNLVGYVEVGYTVDRLVSGADTLKEEIIKELVSMPHVTSGLPSLMFELQSFLNQQKPAIPIVTKQDINYMSNICRLREKEEEAIKTLQILGSLLVYRKSQPTSVSSSSELEESDIFIAEPQWLANLFSVILGLDLVDSNGQIPLKSLNKLFEFPIFPMTERSALLNLLQRFDLIYYGAQGVKILDSLDPTLVEEDGERFERSPRHKIKPLNDEEINKLDRWQQNMQTLRNVEVLVPSLFPLESQVNVNKIWSHLFDKSIRSFILNFVFDDFSVILTGLFSRLLIRLFQTTDPQIYWRYGMLTQQDLSYCYITCDSPDERCNSITVRLCGGTPNNLRNFLSSLIRSLVQNYQVHYEERLVEERQPKDEDRKPSWRAGSTLNISEQRLKSTREGIN